MIVFEAGSSQVALAGLEFTVLIRPTLHWQWLFLLLPRAGIAGVQLHAQLSSILCLDKYGN